MTKGRLEAFSDGVIAILITIMVLEFRPPEKPTLEALQPLGSILLSYVLSFVNLGIYWSNHHHLIQAAKVVDGRVLWANLHLLFWLSLFPFGTAWMGESSFATVPTAVYGVPLVMAAIAYFLLVRALIAAPGQTETLAAAIGSDVKGKGSIVVYLVAIPIALVAPLVTFGLYVAVAVLWFVPDRRMERALGR
jgi:TMEM175 potassium channel family protein